ncbi:MAG: hypothetical protein C4516_00035 [Oxalobacter sp.]|nr:MAG: hypothetical protein C4516_00035 [Oxalobacter sp.]
MISKKQVCFFWVGLVTCVHAAFAQPVNITEPAVCYPPQVYWENYDWVMLKGGKSAACQEMLNYLRSRPKESPPPVCLKERLPQNINWTRPDWKVLPQEKRDALLKNISSSNMRTVEQLQKAKEWKVVRLDVTQDDIPETLLAYGRGDADCHKAARCAVPEGEMKGYISLNSTSGGDTALLAMTDDARQIKFHQSRGKPLIKYGELVFYKDRPYWISPLRWEQKFHDNFPNNRAITNPKNKYNRMFQMAPLKFRSVRRKLQQGDEEFKKLQRKDFKYANALYPNPSAACFFGYFHRDNLK